MKVQNIVIILAVAVCNICGANETLPDVESDIRLFSSMARSADPAHSMECFDYYIPLIKQIVETFKNEHSACLKNSYEGRIKADEATLANRLQLAGKANNSCELLTQCSEITSPSTFFECYAAAGSQNTKTMYDININSTDYWSNLQEEYRLVENTEYKCTNESKRKYEWDSAIAYEDFSNCNLGIIDAPQPTEAVSTTQSPAPTGEPETTASPVSSTQTSVETTAEPVAPTDAPRRFRKVKFNRA